MSQATAWRYVDETLDVLAGWAPGLHEALTGLGEGDHVIVDGTLIPIDRVAADEPYYSMKHRKHRKHGMNVQVIARPDGTPLWFSRATPGRDHARPRAPGERAFAQVKSWRPLRRARCSTRRIGTIVQARGQGFGARRWSVTTCCPSLHPPPCASRSPYSPPKTPEGWSGSHPASGPAQGVRRW